MLQFHCKQAMQSINQLEGKLQYSIITDSKKMLSNHMIQMFTKKIENLSKHKQDPTDAPQQYQIIEECVSSGSASASGSNSGSAIDDSLKSGTAGRSSSMEPGGLSSESRRESSASMRIETGTEKKNGLDIPLKGYQKQILENIKNKLTKLKPLKNEAEIPKRITKTPSKSLTLRNQKKIDREPSVSSSKSSLQSEQQKSGSQAQDKKRAICQQIIRQGKNMTPDQKFTLLRHKAKTYKIISTHQLKIWVDAYQMIFNVEKDIKNVADPVDEKYISKKFAQHFMRYVKKNPKEKKYKFRRICAIAIKELNMVSQRVDPWLNRFILQNSGQLKDVDLSQYRLAARVRGSSKTEENQKQPVKEIKMIKKPSSKEGDKVQKKQRVKPGRKPFKRDQSSEKKEEMKEKSTSQTINRKNTFKSDSQVEQVQQQGDQLQKVQVVAKKRRGRRPNSEINSQPIISRPRIQIVAQKPKQQEGLLSLTAAITKQKQKALVRQAITQKIEAPIQKKQAVTSNLKLQFSYPQNFRKKIAAKLDLAFNQVFQAIIKEKCDQLCVQEEALRQIYEQYGSHYLKKDQLATESRVSSMGLVPNPKPSPVLNVIPEQNSFFDNQDMADPYHYSSQFVSYDVARENLKYDQFDNKKKVQEEKKEKIKSPPVVQSVQVQTETQERTPQQNKSTLPMAEESKNDMAKHRSPYAILNQRLSQFLRQNLGCSEAIIKDEAVRLSTSIPEIAGRIRQQSLAHWIHVFIQRNRDRISSVKPKFNNERPNFPNNSIRAPQESLQPKIMIKPSPPPNSVPTISNTQAMRNFHIAMPKMNRPRVESKEQGQGHQYRQNQNNGSN